MNIIRYFPHLLRNNLGSVDLWLYYVVGGMACNIACLVIPSQWKTLFFLVLCSLQPVVLAYPWLEKSLTIHNLHYLVYHSPCIYLFLTCFTSCFHVALLVHLLGITSTGVAWGKLMCSFLSTFTTPL